jgi:hypothetical protein
MSTYYPKPLAQSNIIKHEVIGNIDALVAAPSEILLKFN